MLFNLPADMLGIISDKVGSVEWEYSMRNLCKSSRQMLGVDPSASAPWTVRLQSCTNTQMFMEAYDDMREDKKARKAMLGLIVENGLIRALEYMNAHENVTLDDEQLYTAAYNGNVEILQWSYAKGDLSGDMSWYMKDVCDGAAHGGHLAILEWVDDRWVVNSQPPWTTRTCCLAAHYGHLDILKWLHAKRCPWNENVISEAAYEGHMHIVKWLRANGCPWDEWTCTAIACNDKLDDMLDMLKWARAHGCPWDEWTCAAIASTGKLDMLKWARANGCPWDANTCKEAMGSKHMDIFRWARANGCPWDGDEPQ